MSWVIFMFWKAYMEMAINSKHLKLLLIVVALAEDFFWYCKNRENIICINRKYDCLYSILCTYYVSYVIWCVIDDDADYMPKQWSPTLSCFHAGILNCAQSEISDPQANNKSVCVCARALVHRSICVWVCMAMCEVKDRQSWLPSSMLNVTEV
jgi:hypothetical protein